MRGASLPSMWYTTSASSHIKPRNLMVRMSGDRVHALESDACCAHTLECLWLTAARDVSVDPRRIHKQ